MYIDMLITHLNIKGKSYLLSIVFVIIEILEIFFLHDLLEFCAVCNF